MTPAMPTRCNCSSVPAAAMNTHAASSCSCTGPTCRSLARLKADRLLQAKLDDSDLVQDTCLSAHRDFAQFRGATEHEFTAWLREIMAHTAANLARDHRRQRRDVRLERQLYDLLNQSSQMMERAIGGS